MGRMVRKIRRKAGEKPCLALSVPAFLCFLSFITNFVTALKDGNIDGNELHQLLSVADGFETVVLLLVMVVLKDKKK